MGIKDLTGQRFGRWRIVGYSHTDHNRRSAFWLCECDCGTRRSVSGNSLRMGDTKSCGCLHRETVSNSSKIHRFKHGHSANKKISREYYIWVAMRQRCENDNDKSYPNYGGRGIRVCDRWKSFKNFIEDIGLKPTSAHTLERKNVNGDYALYNCKWATRKEQAANTRKTRRDNLEYFLSMWPDAQ